MLAENRVAPNVILAPNRLRAKLLAGALKDSFELASDRENVPLLLASLRVGRWRLPEADVRALCDESVLIVDSAAGHGKTLDRLSMLALRAGARRVAATVLLSRLTEGCARSFAARLGGGFHVLYQLPVRPVVIHGAGRELCPVCQYRAAVHDAVLESRLEAIERRDALLSPTRRGKPVAREEGRTSSPPMQEASLFLSPAPAFLETCSRGVASGVALHSLYAAKTNGMAALALPEITNEAIPPENRAAMLEHLPWGVVEWSRGAPDRDLERCLATARNGTLWRASADVLARERQARWIDYLDTFLMRLARRRIRPAPTFWSALARSLYLVTRRNLERKSRGGESDRAVASGVHWQYIRRGAPAVA